MKNTGLIITLLLVQILVVLAGCSKEDIEQDETGNVASFIEISNSSLENSGTAWNILGIDWSEDLWSDDAYYGSTSANISTNSERQRCVLMSPKIQSLEPGTTARIYFHAKWLSGDNTVFVDFYTQGVVGLSPGQWQGEIPKDGEWHQIEVDIEVPAYLTIENFIKLRIGIPYPKQSNWKKPTEDFVAANYLIDDITLAVLDTEINEMKKARDNVSHSFDESDVRDNHSRFGVYWTPWKAYSKFSHNTPEDYNKSKEEIEQELDLMQETGVKWVRSVWRWDKIEWTKGNPDYEFLDYVVEEAWKRDIRILAGLFYTPNWASTAPAGYSDYCTFPPNMDDWESFVYNLVSHFKSKIKYWEIWNEPNQWNSYYWQGTANDFLELQKVGYNAAKNADPDCGILFGAFAGSGFGDLYKLLELGIKDYFDILSIHPYSASSDLNVDNAVYAVKVVRLALAQYECENKPIWFTEIGWPKSSSASDISDSQRAEMLKYVYAYPFHEAVEKIFWFPFDTWGSSLPSDGVSGLVHTYSGQIYKSPSFDAYREVTSGE